MIKDRSPRYKADQYLQLFTNDEAMRSSLLACSAGLSLDDEVASEAIEVVLPQSAQTQDILARIKRLGCVVRNWDGSWRISEDVRVGLADLLSRQFPADRLTEIRIRLASKAEHKATSLSPDGQITNYRVREARFQAAYQKLLMPGRIEEGAQLCAEIWRQASTDAREATCSAADYVSDEVQRQVKELPPELLFLRGMAARARGDRNGAREYFYLVWKQGRPGDIFAIAAHLFGNLSLDRERAERALRDSLQWYDDRSHQGQVWHSLGNLLSRQRARLERSRGSLPQEPPIAARPCGSRTGLAFAGQLAQSPESALERSRGGLPREPPTAARPCTPRAGLAFTGEPAQPPESALERSGGGLPQEPPIAARPCGPRAGLAFTGELAEPPEQSLAGN